MRLYIITKRNLISIGFCLLIGVLAGAIAVTSTVRAVQSAAAQREIPIYYVDTDKKQVALSFDAAWGNEQTEHLLEILDKYKVKSTFFLVGDWVKNYPDSVKDIAHIVTVSRCGQSQQHPSAYDADVIVRYGRSDSVLQRKNQGAYGQNSHPVPCPLRRLQQ